MLIIAIRRHRLLPFRHQYHHQQFLRLEQVKASHPVTTPLMNPSLVLPSPRLTPLTLLTGANPTWLTARELHLMLVSRAFGTDPNNPFLCPRVNWTCLLPLTSSLNAALTPILAARDARVWQWGNTTICNREVVTMCITASTKSGNYVPRTPPFFWLNSIYIQLELKHYSIY